MRVSGYFFRKCTTKFKRKAILERVDWSKVETRGHNLLLHKKLCKFAIFRRSFNFLQYNTPQYEYSLMETKSGAFKRFWFLSIYKLNMCNKGNSASHRSYTRHHSPLFPPYFIWRSRTRKFSTIHPQTQPLTHVSPRNSLQAKEVRVSWYIFSSWMKNMGSLLPSYAWILYPITPPSGMSKMIHKMRVGTVQRMGLGWMIEILLGRAVATRKNIKCKNWNTYFQYSAIFFPSWFTMKFIKRFRAQSLRKL